MEEKNKKKPSKKTKKENKNVNKKDTKLKFKHKHPKLSIFLKLLLILFLILCVIGAGVLIGLMYGLWGDDLKIDISELVLSENSVILDADGNTLAQLSGDESRKIITLEEMSPYLPKAYIAIEDERFEQHHGVDIKRTVAATLSFITHGGKSTAGGGSTITQQLVKNITKEKDSSGIKGIMRKAKEWAKAYQIEKELSKDQILELYLNLIFVGGQVNGVEMGAEYYFNTTAKDLSIAQCAFLAGINNSPNKYNPYGQTDTTELITKRTKTVLSQMKKFNYVTQEEYDAAVAEVEAGFKFENGAKAGNIYSSHTDALISQLIDQIMEEKQISEDAAKTYLYSSGLTIYSTQVSSVQTAMETEAKNPKYNVKSRKTKDENGNYVLAQGASVVIEPTTGKVVGCIGQLREKTTSRGQNRATQTTRGTGSSFKPLAALVPGIEEGVATPATIYDDSYTKFKVGNQIYDPKNYNSYTGLRTVRTAVTTSQNIPFIKIVAEVGNAKTREYLKKMGITSLDDNRDTGLAIAIGGLTNGVSPLEMAGAYATIANNGTYIQPTFYSKVEDSEGKVVLEPVQRKEKVFSEATAYVIKNLLTSVVNGADGYNGTASYCRIKGIDVAAKTGTTNASYDRWLCGFTNYYACATWFGFDIQEEMYGNTNWAGRLFAGIMSSIHKGLPASTFEKPDSVVTATICRTSGRLATEKCSNTYSEVFVKDHVPEACDAHQGQYTICKDSGKLANEFCPSSSKEVRGKYIVEKERLGLWETATSASSSAPTEYCNIHTKASTTVVKPEQPTTTEPKPTTPEEPTTPTEPEKPTEPTEPTTPTEPEKPTEPPEPTTPGGDTGETGDNTTKPQT